MISFEVFKVDREEMVADIEVGLCTLFFVFLTLPFKA